jgi:hypothetical protein
MDDVVPGGGLTGGDTWHGTFAHESMTHGLWRPNVLTLEA